MNFGLLIYGAGIILLLLVAVFFLGLWWLIPLLFIVFIVGVGSKMVTVKKGEFKPEFKGPTLDFGVWSMGRIFKYLLTISLIIITIVNFGFVLGFIEEKISQIADFTENIGPHKFIVISLITLVGLGIWFLLLKGGPFVESVFGLPILILFLGLIGAGFYYLRQFEPFSKIAPEWILLGGFFAFGIIALVLLREEKSVFKFLIITLVIIASIGVGYFIVQGTGFKAVNDFVSLIVKYTEEKPQFFFLMVGAFLLVLFAIAIPFEKNAYKAFRLVFILGGIGVLVYYVFSHNMVFLAPESLSQGVSNFYHQLLQLQNIQSAVIVPGDTPPSDIDFSQETAYLSYDFGETIKQIDVRFSPGDKVNIKFAGGCSINQEDPARIWMKIGKGEVNSRFTHPYLVQLTRETELIIPKNIKVLCPYGVCFPRFAFSGCLKVQSNKIWIDEYLVNGVSRVRWLKK